MVIPDSKELTVGVTCEWTEALEPVNCKADPKRVQIDIGYLRWILEALTICDQKNI